MRHGRRQLTCGAVLAVAISLGCALLGSTPAGAPVDDMSAMLAQWVELGPASVVIARAITSRADCPVVNFGAESQRMYVRAQPDAAHFPVRVCEMVLAPGTAAAAIEGRVLPMPRPNPRRIVVIGDTGCRLKEPQAFQACNDVRAWPFARIARSAAGLKPDLVIHVGDYLYREAPCPVGNAGCAGSPSGNNWHTWEADFFAPAAELLRAAPWVVARGNHEVCSRAGHGWFRFLDPQLPALGCRHYTPAYRIPLGDLQLLMLDTANVPDEGAPAESVVFYAAQFEALRQADGGPAWLVMHRPIWGVGQPDDARKGADPFQLNATLQAASNNDLGAHVRLVLSGHVHAFEALGFAAGRPPQLIVGQSGTSLDPPITSPIVGTEIAGAAVAHGIALARFGFTTLESSDWGWMATVRDVDGRAIAQCRLALDGMSCGE